MNESPHVMLAGRGAEQFAKDHELDIVNPGYFVDSARYRKFHIGGRLKKLTSRVPITQARRKKNLERLVQWL